MAISAVIRRVRTLIQGAGIGIGAAVLPAAASAAEQQAAAPPADFWTGEYWASKGKRPALYVSGKRVGAPQAGEKPKPVLFLVHGSSNSSRPSFDLTVPGKGEYSLMNVFARHGFDVWTMDHEGYGRSTRTAGNSDIASAVEDLKAATEVVVRETGQFTRPISSANRRARSAPALRDGTAGTRRPARPASLRVDRRRLADVEGPGEESRLFPHPQPPSARPRHDPLDLHAR